MRKTITIQFFALCLLFLVPRPAFTVENPGKDWRIRRENNAFVLQSESCATVEAIAADLSRWRQRAGEPLSTVGLQQRPDGCSVQLDDHLPSRFTGILHTHPLFDGPNCWNTVLNAAGVLSHLRYTDDSTELKFYLESPQCRPLRATENPELGDIGLIRTIPPEETKWVENHAFFHISSRIVFTKDNPSFRAPYALQTPAQTLAHYNLGEDAPPHCRDSRDDNNSGCRDFVTYYRCEPSQSYWGAGGNIVVRGIKQLDSRVSELEALISRYVFGHSRVDETLAGEVQKLHATLYDQFDQLSRGTGVLSEIERLILERARVTLDSLAYQIAGFYYPEMRVNSPEVIWYWHEPGQGARLTPTPVGEQALRVEHLNR